MLIWAVWWVGQGWDAGGLDIRFLIWWSWDGGRGGEVVRGVREGWRWLIGILGISMLQYFERRGLVGRGWGFS